MKRIFIIAIAFFTVHANAKEDNKSCANFFEGIQASDLKKEDVMKMISADPKYKSYLSLMDAKIVDVQDTGARFRCFQCYNYLVKYKDNKTGNMWIAETPVEIVQGEVKQNSEREKKSGKVNTQN